MKRRSLTPSLAFLVALAFVPAVASAATFSSISWTVTGGTFNGPNSTGPITGGTVVYTPPGPRQKFQGRLDLPGFFGPKIPRRRPAPGSLLNFSERTLPA